MAERLGPVRSHEDGQEPGLLGVEPETEKTEGQEGKVVAVLDVAREAVPAGCEVREVPGHGGGAVDGTGRRQELGAGSVLHSRVAKVGVGREVFVDAELGPAGYGSGLEMEQEPEAGQVAEILMVKPEGVRMEH